MSEDIKNKETAEAGTDEAVSPEPTEEQAPAEDHATAEQEEKAPQPAAQPRRGTSPVSWLALFLALLALAAGGYMIVEDRRTRAVEEASSDTVERLAGRIDESQSTLSGLDDSLEDLAASDEALESRIAELQLCIGDLHVVLGFCEQPRVARTC